MIDIATGAAAGVIGATSTEILHHDPNARPQEDYLQELCDLLQLLNNYFSQTYQNKPDHRVTFLVSSGQNLPINRNGYKGVYILVPAAATLNILVSGLPSFQLPFATAPTPGQLPVGLYNRWRYEDGTQVSLNTPTQQNFPIEILFTDDLTN